MGNISLNGELNYARKKIKINLNDFAQYKHFLKVYKNYYIYIVMSPY